MISPHLTNICNPNNKHAFMVISVSMAHIIYALFYSCLKYRSPKYYISSSTPVSLVSFNITFVTDLEKVTKKVINMTRN